MSSIYNKALKAVGIRKKESNLNSLNSLTRNVEKSIDSNRNMMYKNMEASNRQILEKEKKRIAQNVNSSNSKVAFRSYIKKEPIHNILNNIILATDSYKLTHWTMYEKLGITHVYSYLEARAGADFSHTVWFGLKYFLEKLQAVKIDVPLVKRCKDFIETNVGAGYFNEAMWMKIAQHYDGKLPVIIRAAEEGSVIPKGNVLLTIENVDPDCVGLVNHLESLLLQVWYPCTVATLSKAVKDAINRCKIEVTEEHDVVLKGFVFPSSMWTNHQLLDFGYRGASSIETAAIGGLGHLTNFVGSDTIAASLLGAQCYGMDVFKPAIEGGAYSVAATEHSIMTSLGRESEKDLLRALIMNHSGGVLSLVMDSYNIFEAIDFICNDHELVERILNIPDDNRRLPGKVVFRPDSGSPSEVIPIILGIIEKSELGKSSKGGIKVIESINGFYYFTSSVGILWGDGMELSTITKLLKDLTTGFKESKVLKNGKNKNSYIVKRTVGNEINKNNPEYGKANMQNVNAPKSYPRTLKKWSPSILLFGMGGGLLQKVSRDTQDFAFKCSANKVNGTVRNSRPESNKTINNDIHRNNVNVNKDEEWIGVIKNPITGSGKKSKKGLLKLVKKDGQYKTLESVVSSGNNNPQFGKINDDDNLLKVVFKNGELVGPYKSNNASKMVNFDNIKNRIVDENVTIEHK